MLILVVYGEVAEWTSISVCQNCSSSVSVSRSLTDDLESHVENATRFSTSMFVTDDTSIRQYHPPPQTARGSLTGRWIERLGIGGRTVPYGQGRSPVARRSSQVKVVGESPVHRTDAPTYERLEKTRQGCVKVMLAELRGVRWSVAGGGGAWMTITW